MRKILLSTVITVAALAALAAGGTGAFFSDSEVSAGNTFAAGAIDLKVDNESYYNGALFAGTSWELVDLTIEKFFNFSDIKPGDYGEDTISLHVDTNDAYLCAEVTLTSNDDNGLTEPEGLLDQTGGVGEGELAQNVNFIWWADDGDNVLEVGEEPISGGPIGNIGVGQSVTVPLADSQNNIWENAPGPAPGDETLYIGKAWCFGKIEAKPLPLASYDSPADPANDTLDPTGKATPEDGGIICDGTLLDNSTQTDSLTADVKFTAVQARHNPNFLCTPPVGREAKLTVIKVVTNDNGGNNVVGDFQLFADDGVNLVPATSGVTVVVPAGNYTITETGVAGYVASFSGDCDSVGTITLNPGDSKTCTITNNDLPANITLIKNVINNSGGIAGPTQFGLKVDGGLVQNNTSVAVSSNVAHAIDETGRAGYTFVGPITGTSNYGKSCPAALGGLITLDEGEAITCTITNDDN